MNSNSSFSVEELIEKSIKKTGVGEFDDVSFLRPLRVLVDCYHSDNNSGFKDFFVRNDLIRLLSNRLRVEQNYREYPEIKDIIIRKPMFIIGLGRTGSTYLHNLLAQDPSVRTLRYWELQRPSLCSTYDKATYDRNISMAKNEINGLYKNAFDLKRAHKMVYDGPEECCHLMFHTFMAKGFYITYNTVSYIQWLIKQDLRPAYQYYEKMLKLLFYRESRERIVLKDPTHLSYLNIIAEQFPDARFVWLHRDPKKIIPSSLGLYSLLNGKKDVDENKQFVKQLGRDLRSACQIRKELGDNIFYDVDFNTLIKEPIETIKRIYKYFDILYSKDAEYNMRVWINKNNHNSHNKKHVYCLDEFGLTEGLVKEEFAFYYELNIL